ncbi:MAG: sterol desaturase family protein [Nitrospiria bacterium]
MDVFSTPAGWRAFAAIGGLVLFLWVENRRPFRRRNDSVLPHYGLNLSLMIGNGAAVALVFGGVAVRYAAYLSSQGIGVLNFFPVSPFWNIVLTLIFYDLTTYCFHIAYHRIPVLWRLHRVHHCDRDLDVTSASRFHLGEVFLSTYLQIGLMTLLGPRTSSVLVFQAVMLSAAQFQHSNFKFPTPIDSAIRWIFVTPDMHRVHHSDLRENTNANYATIFSIWDRLFHSYHMVPQESITIGLQEYIHPEDRRLKQLLLMPFAPGCPRELDPAKKVV